ncbi:hypothetical protein DXG03_005410 [Asterophora parasitica]|uniref:Programmed cell death protein 2 C-terminal domain-containing protein n=1 Tax=Asterophora parasitica TaxID=117018 RepID=A0A9P7GE89_9AGAR|nr:hypothetical protein DXG03_005410 [Asterophora parasitica]
MGAQIFGDAPAPPPTISETQVSDEETIRDAEEDGDDDDEGSSEDELLTAMASVTVEESPWKAAPSYPPIYLSTVSEYLPPQSKAKLPPGAQVSDPLDDDSKGGKDKDISWASEAYEDSLEMDHVFERFTKRVAFEGEQCVRYELDGTPLPFSSDKIFTSLFPSPPAPTIHVTRAAHAAIPTPKRTYFPTNVSPCPSCSGKRVFECQLMPNLINVLRRPPVAKAKQTDEERRKAVEQALKGTGTTEEGRMEWGTCIVFSCENDCCTEDGKPTREAWREEVVLVQAAI